MQRPGPSGTHRGTMPAPDHDQRGTAEAVERLARREDRAQAVGGGLPRDQQRQHDEQRGDVGSQALQVERDQRQDQDDAEVDRLRGHGEDSR